MEANSLQGALGTKGDPMFGEVPSGDNQTFAAARFCFGGVDGDSGLESDHFVGGYHLVHSVEAPLKNNLEFSEIPPWILGRK